MPLARTKIPENFDKFDKATKTIWKLLTRLRLRFLADTYIVHSMLFNFMVVGTSGVFLSWILFSVILRPLSMKIAPQGEFVAYVVTALCTFMWNFIWNKKWALNIKAQLIRLKREELSAAQQIIGDLLDEKDAERKSTEKNHK